MARVSYATVPLSGQLSGPIGLTNAGELSLFVPVVNSCQMELWGSWDGAGYYPLLASTTSANAVYLVGTGSKMVMVGDVALTHAKVNLSVPQAAVRSLAAVTR